MERRRASEPCFKSQNPTCITDAHLGRQPFLRDHPTEQPCLCSHSPRTGLCPPSEARASQLPDPRTPTSLSPTELKGQRGLGTQGWIFYPQELFNAVAEYISKIASV